MTRTRAVIIALLLLLFLISLTSFWLQPSAIEVAKAAAIAHGWKADDLAMAGFKWQSGAFGLGQTQTVDFFVSNEQPPKKVRVTLSRPIYFLGWHVDECAEFQQ